MTTQHSENSTLKRNMRKALLNLGLRHSGDMLDLIEEFQNMLQDEPIIVPSQAFISPRLLEQLLKPKT
jgi:hypothetical protein